jgi:hypothetical protein
MLNPQHADDRPRCANLSKSAISSDPCRARAQRRSVHDVAAQRGFRSVTTFALE